MGTPPSQRAKRRAWRTLAPAAPVTVRHGVLEPCPSCGRRRLLFGKSRFEVWSGLGPSLP
jgi:hypothetical protein